MDASHDLSGPTAGANEDETIAPASGLAEDECPPTPEIAATQAAEGLQLEDLQAMDDALCDDAEEGMDAHGDLNASVGPTSSAGSQDGPADGPAEDAVDAPSPIAEDGEANPPQPMPATGRPKGLKARFCAPRSATSNAQGTDAPPAPPKSKRAKSKAKPSKPSVLGGSSEQGMDVAMDGAATEGATMDGAVTQDVAIDGAATDDKAMDGATAKKNKASKKRKAEQAATPSKPAAKRKVNLAIYKCAAT